MNQELDTILKKKEFSREEIIRLLNLEGEAADKLFKKAASVRKKVLGNKVYLRGLIELSNTCQKNCLYCGIRKDNKEVQRYSMSVEEVLRTAKEALENGFTSLVLQCGEIQSPAFTKRISSILRGIRELSDGKFHITLSCGEQSPETYTEWLEAGASRYLLRIETSNPELYKSIHPRDDGHCHPTRLNALKSLQELGYQSGTGVMIGMPFQSVSDLADDLIFFREKKIDMVGMGPYVEEPDSPMYQYRQLLWPGEIRFLMTRKMVAVLRLMMPDINIAATTASEALVPHSRETLISTGANVIMPNITPLIYQGNYSLYANKPDTYFNKNGHFDKFSEGIEKLGYSLKPGEWGDSLHYLEKKNNISFQLR